MGNRGPAGLTAAQRKLLWESWQCGHGMRAIQHYLGHRNITHTVRYTEVSPERFKGFWKDCGLATFAACPVSACPVGHDKIGAAQPAANFGLSVPWWDRLFGSSRWPAQKESPLTAIAVLDANRKAEARFLDLFLIKQ